MLYAPEQFSDDESVKLRPYFTNLDRPVFALTNLPEVVKGALFARYSRSDKSLRRLFLDEFVDDLDLSGDLTVDASVGLRRRRAALRPRVPRVRRRLGRPARRRAPRVRAGVEPAHEGARTRPAHGLPRAVDALHPVRLAPRRPLPLLPRSGAVRVAVRHPLRRRDGRALRHVPRSAAGDGGVGARPLSEGGGRLRLRLQADDQGQGLRLGARRAARPRRSRTSASTAPARRSRRCCCACAPTRCPRRTRTRR